MNKEEDTNKNEIIIEQDQDPEQEYYEIKKVIVDKGQSPLRIDKFLANRMENVSRTRIYHASEAGLIMVNNEPVKVNYKVKPYDVITVMYYNKPANTEIIPEDIPLNIFYEDDELAIINKPPGIAMHPGISTFSGTLVNALAFHFRNLPSSGNENDRPGLVHRIDKFTSGLIVVAKTEQAMASLQKQFFYHTIDRVYWALVWGDVAQSEGTIVANVGRNPSDPKTMTVFPDGSQGKTAVTHYRVLERFNYVTLIECKLETGRTHQIRVHMKYLGHPLFSDETYGGAQILKGTTFSKYRQFIDNCFRILPRQALHAKTLGFVHPKTGAHMVFESELPEDFSTVIEKWRRYSKGSRMEEEIQED